MRLQCRQKTVEVKAKCTKCTLFWCPRCLSNRYGEEVEEVLFKPQHHSSSAGRGLQFQTSIYRTAGVKAEGVAVPQMQRRLQLQQLPQGDPCKGH